MNQPYEFWYHPVHTLVASILSNTDFHGEFDYIPFRDFSVDNHQCHYQTSCRAIGPGYKRCIVLSLRINSDLTVE